MEVIRSNIEEKYNIEEKITIKNMRNLSQYLIEQEKTKERIDVKINPITIIEWYKSDSFKNTFKLQSWNSKFDSLITPLGSNLGENNRDEKTIYLFLNNFKILKLLNPKHTIVDFIHTTYHELRHSYQQQYIKNYNNLESFSIAFLNNFIIEHSPTHYDIYYSQYFDEIDANLYAIKKTEQFLKNYPSIYLKHQKYIDKLKEKYQYNYENYNFQLFFDKFHNIYKQDPKTFQNHHIISNVFYKENSSEFKTITEILSNKNFDFFKGNLFSSIITSKSFLDQLDLSSLTTTETNIMTEALTYEYNLEIKKYKRNIAYQNNTKDIFTKSYLIYENLVITKRIDYLEKKFNYLSYNNETIIKNK